MVIVYATLGCFDTYAACKDNSVSKLPVLTGLCQPAHECLNDKSGGGSDEDDDDTTDDDNRKPANSLSF